MYGFDAPGSFAYTYEEMLFFIKTELTTGAERLTLEYPGDSDFPSGAVRKDISQAESIAYGGAETLAGDKPDYRHWDDLDDYINRNATGQSGLRLALPAAVNIFGSEVVPIERHVAEEARQGLTNEAMLSGADVIVGGQLATGQFAGLVDIMVREPGSCDFGDYFYMPCAISSGDELYAALRLCFIADILQNLQGVLPPRLLLFQGDRKPEYLDTEKYIQYFRALKYRFITSRHVPEEWGDTASPSHRGSRDGAELSSERAARQVEASSRAMALEACRLGRTRVSPSACSNEQLFRLGHAPAEWTLASALDHLLPARNVAEHSTNTSGNESSMDYDTQGNRPAFRYPSVASGS